MDAFLPGVGDWGTVYNNPAIWHFRFNGQRQKPWFTGASVCTLNIFLDDLAAPTRSRSLLEADRKAYAEALCQAGTHARGLGLLRFVPASREGILLNSLRLG